MSARAEPSRHGTACAKPRVALALKLTFPFALQALALGAANAYGVEGHLIAGRVAAAYLCPEAVAEVGLLGDGQGLDELGLWADRARSTQRYAHTAPWHYMNVSDAEALADFVSPPEGDVLSALREQHAILASAGRSSRAERAEALRFLVHLLVDLHQPLHVGRAEDRGGNTIDVLLDGERLNLHRVWDTEAVTSGGTGIVAYAREIATEISETQLATEFDPERWAEESLRLRPAVYAFDQAGPQLSPKYMSEARAITRERLTLAAARLAGVLNGLFCTTAPANR